MSKDPSTEERQRNLQQRREFFAHMLPLNPFDAEMFKGPASFAPQDLPVHRPSGQLPYPGAGDPFQLNMSPPLMAKTNVHRGALVNSPYARAEFKLPRAYHPPPPSRSPVWPTYSPGYNEPVSQMHSRLPPNDVARKAPRRSTANAPPQKCPPLQRSNSKFKSTQKRKTKREDSLQRERSDTSQHEEGAHVGQHKRLKTAHRTTGKASISASGLPNLSSASKRDRRRVAVDDEDDEDDGVNEYNIPIPSIESDTGESAASATKAATSAARKSQPLQIFKSQHPRPRYDYTVPKKLDAIKQALGEEDWDEYLIATEEKFLGKITEHEFVARSKGLFMVFDVQTRWRIVKLVDYMVAPVVKEHAAEAAEVQRP
jgi:hypothetical protein